MDFKRIVALSANSEKTLVSPNNLDYFDCRWIIGDCAGLCYGAIYLHALLGAYHVYIRHFCFLSRQRRMFD